MLLHTAIEIVNQAETLYLKRINEVRTLTGLHPLRPTPKDETYHSLVECATTMEFYVKEIKKAEEKIEELLADTTPAGKKILDLAHEVGLVV